LTTTTLETEKYLRQRLFHYFKMLKNKASLDEKIQEALGKLQRSVDDLLACVKDANTKLDHLIVVYHADRYIPPHNQPYDPTGYYKS